MVPFLQAEQTRHIIGMIECQKLSPKALEHNCEFGMAVLKSFRRKGIGTQLIRRIEGWAKRRKFRRIELNVFSINKLGIKLYKRLGYIKDGCRKKAVMVKEGNYCDLIHMSKAIKEVRHSI